MAKAKKAAQWRNLVQQHSQKQDGINEIKATPILTETVRRKGSNLDASNEKIFPQYGLLAGVGDAEHQPDFIHYNIASPSSVFICGSQGSGKSHTLSCLLENCLIPSEANELPHPLTGIVFHYDTFISDDGGSPCEAAFLASNPQIKMRVLCAPTNIATIKATYSRFQNVAVEELRIKEEDLNTKRMMDLMAVKTGGSMPLYMQVVKRILRDLRLKQQATGKGFSYQEFRTLVDNEDLSDGQRVPLEQRLDTLESFMAIIKDNNKLGAVEPNKQIANNSKKNTTTGIDWTSQPGQLTIVDLSCPTIDPESACQLFNICLSLFLEQEPARVGRIIALDEAHKYMNSSGEANVLTDQLLSTIRLQRHLGARVLISTQEPTVSPKLLDLCSVTIVHRFTSPEWLRALQKHLAGVSGPSRILEKASASGGSEESDGDDSGMRDLTKVLPTLKIKVKEGGGERAAAESVFAQIVGLRVGEALLFAPSAVVDIGAGATTRKLGNNVLKVRIRARVTEDGGCSVMAG